MALVKGENSYATVAEAVAYYDERLYSSAWDNVGDDAESALITATRFMDNLCIWSGDKTDEEQLLEFPKDGDTETPVDIISAMLEIAIEMVGQSIASFVPTKYELDKLKAGSVQLDFPELSSDEITVINSLTRSILSKYGSCNFGGDSIQNVDLIR